jgi:hypothetical protein
VTSESGRPEERRWLVEPPGPGGLKFKIAVGDEVQVTPEIRQAYETLLEALGGGEVEAYDMAGSDCAGYRKGCGTNVFSCSPRRKCFAEVQQPCLIDYHCVISP